MEAYALRTFQGQQTSKASFVRKGFASSNGMTISGSPGQKHISNGSACTPQRVYRHNMIIVITDFRVI